MRAQLQQLRELPPPEGDEAEIQEMLDAFEQGIDEDRGVPRQLAGGAALDPDHRGARALRRLRLRVLQPPGPDHSQSELMAALERISIAAIEDSAEDLADQGRAAEAAGIDLRLDAGAVRSSVAATWLASKTDKVGIGTGIAWAFTRSAFILAVSALDIDEMSGGRFRLGLGAG